GGGMLLAWMFISNSSHGLVEPWRGSVAADAAPSLSPARTRSRQCTISAFIDLRFAAARLRMRSRMLSGNRSATCAAFRSIISTLRYLHRDSADILICQAYHCVKSD